MKQEYITVGEIVNAHGIQGEMRVLTNDALQPSALLRLSTLYLNGKAVQPRHMRVHKGMLLLTIPQVSDRDAALGCKGIQVSVRRSDVKLPNGVYFDAELLGMTVLDATTQLPLGTLTEIQQYPAHKVYTVQGEKQYLIPAIPKVFIESIDLEQNTMCINYMEGLETDAN